MDVVALAEGAGFVVGVEDGRGPGCGGECGGRVGGGWGEGDDARGEGVMPDLEAEFWREEREEGEC